MIKNYWSIYKTYNLPAYKIQVTSDKKKSRCLCFSIKQKKINYKNDLNNLFDEIKSLRF
jgi:hypothetical protein